MKRTRRHHGTTFKAQVALAAVTGDKTLAELSEQVHVHPTQVTEWKPQLLARAADVFGGDESDVSHTGSQAAPREDRPTGAGA